MRLNIIALSEDLQALILEFQKPINKKEQIPTPSQPKSKRTKLFDVTKISIKKVNKNKYEIN